MSSIAKRLSSMMMAMAVLLFTCVAQAEVVNMADLQPLLNGNDQRVYFWSEQWCDPAAAEAAGGDPWNCMDDGLSRHYSAGTVTDDSGVVWQRRMRNDKETLERTNASGEREMFGGYRHKAYRRFSHDSGWRLFGFSTPPADMTAVTPSTLDVSTLSGPIALPVTLESGVPVPLSWAEAWGRMDRSQWLSSTFLSQTETNPLLAQESAFGAETVTFIGRVDLTQDTAVLAAADSDLASLFGTFEGLETFEAARTSFSDSSFLTNVVKVVFEGQDSEFEGDSPAGQGSYREVRYYAEGIGVVLYYETWDWQRAGETLEQGVDFAFLLGFDVGINSGESFYLARKDVVVNTTAGPGLGLVSVDMFCGPYAANSLEFNNSTYREEVSGYNCGRSDLLVEGNPASVSVPLYYFSDLAEDLALDGDQVVVGARAAGYLPNYDQTQYTSTDFDAATIGFTMELGAEVGGVITRTDGSPIQAARIEFRPTDPSLKVPSSKAHSLFGFTDATGVYTTRLDPAVNYEVRVCDPSLVINDQGWWACGRVDQTNFVDFSYNNPKLMITPSLSSPSIVDAVFPSYPGCDEVTQNCAPGNGGIQTDATISGIVAQDSADGLVPLQADIGVHTPDWSRSYWTKSDANGLFSVGVMQGEEYLVEVWPSYDNTGTIVTDFSGGNWIADPGTPILTSYNVDDPASIPVFDSSAIDSNTCYLDVSEQQICIDIPEIMGKVPGAVMNIWDDHLQTRINMNDASAELAIAIDLGNPVEGRLVDDQGNGIHNAWVGGGMGGANTDTDGYFTINLPSDGGVGSFQVDVWPGWDPVTETQDNSFAGGVVISDGSGGYTLTNNWENAAQFAEDASNWPLIDLDGAEVGTLQGLLIETAPVIAITGTISGLDPSAQAWINAWSPDTYNGSGAPADSSGNFSIPVPAPAAGETVTYEVDFWSDTAFVSQFVTVVVDSSGVVSVDGDTLVTTVSFTAQSGQSISGRVVDEQGNGVAWTWVEFQSTGAGGLDQYGYPLYYFGASTDENGFYSASVQPGSYVGAVHSWDNSYRPNFYNGTVDGASNQMDALPIDVSTTDAAEINFQLSSGASISGTVSFSPVLQSGEYAWVNVYSESTNSWSGAQIEGNGSADYAYTVGGLAEAGDYRLDVWHGNYMGGHYGGTPGDAASSPVFWDLATLLSTLTGNVTDVNLSLSAGSTITLTVTGTFPAGTYVDANLWSDTSYFGAWGSGVATEANTMTVMMYGIDAGAGNAYRMWINTPDGSFISGYYQGDLSTTAGSLVNWDQATLFDVTTDRSLAVELSSGGSISGTITGLPTGVTAWIDTWSESSHSWGGTEIIGTGSPVDFTISGLALAHDYRVSLWSDGAPGGYWAGLGNTVVTNWNDAGRADISDSNNADFTGANMVLELGNTISGTVTGWSGSNEFGWVDTWSNSTYSWAGAGVDSANTSYSLMGLKPGADYQVNLWAEGYTYQDQLADISSTDATVDFVLSTGGSITGSISGLDAYQTVWLDSWSHTTNGWGHTSATADGSGNASYQIEGLSDGDYVVSLWAGNAGYFYNSGGISLQWDQAESVSVASAADVTGIDFAISGIETFSLSGDVTVSGSADVNAYRFVSVWSNSGGWGWAERQGDGSYTIEGLPSGNYYVDANAYDAISVRLATPNPTVTAGVAAGESWTSSWDFNDLGQVPVTVDTTALDVTMSTGLSISGVVDDGTNPMPYVWVSANDLTSGFGQGAMTNGSGEYVIEGIVPNATYRLDVWTPSGEGTLDVVVVGSDMINQDITVAQEQGSIGGTVTVSGTPTEGILVYIYESATGDFIAAAATNSSGVYDIEGLTPETSYRVDVYTPADLDILTASGTATVTTTGGVGTADFAL